VDQIPTELVQTGYEILRSEVHEDISCVWNTEEFPLRWKGPIVFFRKAMQLAGLANCCYVPQALEKFVAFNATRRFIIVSTSTL
jgi:hypothetical protein